MRTVAVVIVSAMLFAGKLLIGSSGHADATSEQQVLATDDKRTAALLRGDPKPLEEIYADDYSLVTGTGQVRAKADQINDLKSGRLHYKNIDVLERQVRMYVDVAVVLCRSRNTIVLNGQLVAQGEERVTRIYKDIAGQWRVIATQATPIR
jgi:uncharacterized protein (TIGR02246 family)